jgi:hypothetical protein
MIAPFLARWPSGAVDRHELPLAVAQEFAAQLREVGCTIVWAPLEAAPPAPMPVHQEPCRERKRAEREQRRQFAELASG